MAASTIVQTPNVDSDLSRDVLAVTEMVKSYLEAPTSTAKGRIDVALWHLEEGSRKLPNETLADRVVNFVAHAAVLIDRQAPTNDLFAKAISREIAGLSERLVRELRTGLSKKQQVVGSYRNGLIALGGALLALWIAFALFRNRLMNVEATADATRAGAPIEAAPMNMLMSHRVMAQVIAQSLTDAAREISESADSLNVVRHYARSEGTARAKAVDDIRRRAMEITDMAERLASFVKVRDNEDYSPVDVNECISEAIRATNAENVASVTFEPGTVVPVSAARPEIRLMLEHVLENSLQANREANKKSKITISTQGEREQTTITVIDNGVGMANTVREGVYQPFYTAKGDGPGIGLTTTNYLVAKYGGTMSIRSVAGTGTVARIVLPGMAPSEADQSRAQGVESDGTPAILRWLAGVSRRTGLAARRKIRPLLSNKFSIY